MASTGALSISGMFRSFPKPVPGRQGDPGLFGPGSMVWRVNGETAMLLGSGRALLMQIAHPMVAAGVADHSEFEADGFDRLWRTLDAVLTVAFGDTEQARAAADHVTTIHRRVTGSRDGRSYSALDPDLLLWVHATLVDTALVTYGRFVGQLTSGDRERYYEEMKRFAILFHVPQEVLPADLGSFERYVAQTVAELDIIPDACALAARILAPPAPASLLPAGTLFREITIGLLPDRLRDGFGLSWSPARERALAAAARLCRAVLPALPARPSRWAHARAARARQAGGGGSSGTGWKRAR